MKEVKFDLRKEYAEKLKQNYLTTGFKQGFEAGYAKAKEDFKRPSEDTIKLLKGIVDSYANSPKGIFCKEVPITEQEIEAVKYVYNILKEGDDENGSTS